MSTLKAKVAESTQATKAQSHGTRIDPSAEIRDDQIRELKRQIFDLHTLFEVSRRFHEVWDVDALMNGILLVAIEHMRVGAAAIAIVDADGAPDLKRQKSKGWDLSLEPEWSIRASDEWARRLAEYRRPLPVEALGALARESMAQVESFRRAGCAVVAPMVRRDRLCGVVYLSDKVDHTPFTSGDFEFLDLLIDQFAVSLDNAHLSDKERRTNEELLATRQRLAVTEKLAALGQMAATIAHEVRNPAGIIHNYLNLIRPALADRETELAHLDIITEELARIELFVRSLLGAFHPEQSQPAPVVLRVPVDEVLEFLKPRLRQCGITVVRQVDSTIPAVHAEAEVLRQVLVNILLNAVDAMQGGGTLTIGTSVDLDRVHLSVSDTGTGIAANLIDSLFDPFVTTKPEGQGSGLGLSICKNLLERFDAQIGAKNAPAGAHGAIFTIHLWRADSKRAAGHPV